MTLFSSGQNDDDELEYEFGGDEEAEEALEEADNGREDERGVALPGLLDERGVELPGLPGEVNMAWVPLALSSCAICCRFMSPMSEFISASDRLPRSSI